MSVKIARIPVESSNIAAVGHDAETETLDVEFHNGTVYRYAEVPLEEHEAWMQADSLGAHFARFIRPRYMGVKLLLPEVETSHEVSRC